MSSSTDPELVALARNGEVDAVEALFRRHYPAIHRYAFRLCGQQQDAEDVAAETFLRMARSIRGFRGDSSLRSWLFRVAANAARDQYQRRRRQERSIEAATRMASRSGTQEHDADQELVTAALAKLPTEQREAIVLTYFEGFSHAEAAEVQGCPEATVSSRVYAAKQKLRALLAARSNA